MATRKDGRVQVSAFIPLSAKKRLDNIKTARTTAGKKMTVADTLTQIIKEASMMTPPKLKTKKGI